MLINPLLNNQHDNSLRFIFVNQKLLYGKGKISVEGNSRNLSLGQ